MRQAAAEGKACQEALLKTGPATSANKKSRARGPAFPCRGLDDLELHTDAEGDAVVLGLDVADSTEVLVAVVGVAVLDAAEHVVGQLDVVAVADGKLVPQSFLKIVQPSDAGIVREILVKVLAL